MLSSKCCQWISNICLFVVARPTLAKSETFLPHRHCQRLSPLSGRQPRPARLPLPEQSILHLVTLSSHLPFAKAKQSDGSMLIITLSRWSWQAGRQAGRQLMHPLHVALWAAPIHTTHDMYEFWARLAGIISRQEPAPACPTVCAPFATSAQREPRHVAWQLAWRGGGWVTEWAII